MRLALAPVATIAALSFRGSLRGLRALALGALAAVPSLVILALLAAHATGAGTVDAAQALFLGLTVPVVFVVVILVLAVAQFRSEIDDDTLAFLSSRSIPRWGLVLGKYLGASGASAVILVPASLLPFALAAASGAPAPPDGAIGAVAALTVLAVLSYTALFLLFGLLTPSALLVGLLYGFLWEELLLLLPGTIPRLTIAFYLHSLGSDLVRSGPLSGYANALPTAAAAAGPILAAIGFVVLAMAIIRYVELVSRRTSV